MFGVYFSLQPAVLTESQLSLLVLTELKLFSVAELVCCAMKGKHLMTDYQFCSGR